MQEKTRHRETERKKESKCKKTKAIFFDEFVVHLVFFIEFPYFMFSNINLLFFLLFSSLRADHFLYVSLKSAFISNEVKCAISQNIWPGTWLALHAIPSMATVTVHGFFVFFVSYDLTEQWQENKKSNKMKKKRKQFFWR